MREIIGRFAKAALMGDQRVNHCGEWWAEPTRKLNLVLALPETPPKFGRRDTEYLAEVAGQMALIGEAHGNGDLCQCKIVARQ
jgi:hypothetical protein